MTVNDLIERLEDYRDGGLGDAEIRLMTQEHYPFENTIVGLTSGEEINSDYEDDEEDDDEEAEADVLYIVEGRQIGYGSKRAWTTCS